MKGSKLQRDELTRKGGKVELSETHVDKKADPLMHLHIQQCMDYIIWDFF
jgi:hypothetical protein